MITGIVLSLLMVLYQSSVPHISILGNVPGTTYYRNLERFEDVKLVEDTLILRFENQLYFGNIGFFKEEIRKLIADQTTEIHHIILDATSIYNIDSSGIKTLRTIDAELQDQKIDLYLSGARGKLRDRLHKSGLITEPDKHHMTIHNAVQYIHNEIVSDHSHRAIQSNQEDEK